MHSRRSLVLAFAACTAAFQVCAADAAEIWKVTGGRTTFNFQAERLHGIGLALENVDMTATAPDPVVMDIEPPYWNVAISPASDLEFSVENDHFVFYSIKGGSIHHRGGLTLRDMESGVSADLHDFVIDYVDVKSDGPGGAKDPRIFFARNPAAAAGDYSLQFEDEMPIFRRDIKKLVMYCSVQMTPEFAHEIGRDWMANQTIGRMEVAADVEYVSGVSTEAPFVPYTGDGHTLTTLDVKQGFLDGITEYGRMGTYPNGTAGISMATTSCNVGDVDVHWYAPMNPDHPGIVMAVYREENGRFEQIGTSYVKHGFYALSSSQCTPCQHPSGGEFLGVGCSDTYGAGNNADRTYLAPRREWNPFLGTWRCTGSHFSGGVSDCTRRHSGSGHNPVEHRVETPDSALNHPGATYYYEGYYVVAGDVNKHNNIGSRRMNATWTGSAWNLTTAGGTNPLIEGPAIERWGDVRSSGAVAPGDGSVTLATKVTALGGGRWHYEYALHNMDSWREVSKIIIPVGLNTEITNIGFHDWDTNPSNDWAMTLSNGKISWETTPFAADTVNGNALQFGYLMNFRFDANVAPRDSSASIEAWRPGPQSSPKLSTKIPDLTQTSVAATLPGIQMMGAQPNPLNPTTSIRFSIQRESDASLEIFGAEGRRVRSLHSGRLAAGTHQLTWDGTDSNGSRVAPGVYYYRLQAGGEEAAQSLVVIR